MKLLCCVLFSLFVHCVCAQGIKYTDTKELAWMKSLKGSLADVLIPGTHDSGALRGGVYAQCQDLSIQKQLELGVRFLDIRCRHMKDDFHIYHGIADQKLKFKQVLKTCSDFLKKHPSECILLSIKEESSPVENSRSFSKTYKELIGPYKKQWYEEETMPKIADARGKMVVVSRHKNVAGIPWRKFFIQDKFKVSGKKEMKRKWKQFLAHQVASENLPKGKVGVINFATGNGFFSPPETVADYMNTQIQSYLDKLDKDKKLRGVIVLDFPPEKLVKTIIQKNFPVPLKDPS